MSNIRTQIAAAAQELFLEKGIDGVSMRKVAELVGVSAPSIYRHYRNKNDLINEIVMTGLAVLESYIRPALEKDTAYERLTGMLDAYLTFAIEQPRYFDFAFLFPIGSFGALPEELAQYDSPTFVKAVEQVQGCMDEGVFRQDEPLETAVTLWAHVHGLVTLYRIQRIGDGTGEFKQIYARSVERLLAGLRA